MGEVPRASNDAVACCDQLASLITFAGAISTVWRLDVLVTKTAT